MKYLNEASSSSSISDQFGHRFNELFGGLFPSIPIVIATIIAFLIVFGLLFYFVYKPVKKLMKERQEFMQNNIDETIKNKEESILRLNDANEGLKNAHIQADQIISQAKIKAEKISDVYIHNAKIESKRILDETSIDISAQQREFNFNSKRYVVEVATEMVKKILKREITKETQDAIITEYLNSDKSVEEL
ncbi:F0F1 ATP synthase subunit B [Mycoplasmopsis cynos]|uniref:F0F1 ATP synthase subunit B n=1 Tax=Mycoplasmopsis cynos TaxID=171284 RepID=UPI002FF004B5